MSVSAFLKTQVICLLVAFGSPAGATTVLQVSFLDLVQRSELIFEGKVVGADARWDDASGTIWTHVRFEILDVIKGPVKGDRLELSFLGGTIGDLTLKVGEMRIPESGEAGIYFVESLSRRQPNPLLGWTQGHFVIQTTASGRRRVLTPKGNPVLSVRKRPEPVRHGISGDTASGLQLGTREKSMDAMSVDAFKNEVGRMLSATSDE